MAMWFQPSWLLLLLFAILLLLVGCSLLPQRTAPEPTPAYAVTLTPSSFALLTPAPNSLPDIPFLHQWTTQQAQSEAIDPPPQRISVEEPVCFPDIAGSQLCMGRIWNGSSQTIHHLALMIAHDFQAESTTRIALEQRSIPNETFAPYHFYLPIEAEIQQLTPDTVPITDESLIPLTISTARGVVGLTGRYVITGTITNDYHAPIEAIRVVGTVINEWGKVVGYRVIDMNTRLGVGESRFIRLEITPQVIDGGLSFTLYADAIYNAP